MEYFYVNEDTGVTETLEVHYVIKSCQFAGKFKDTLIDIAILNNQGDDIRHELPIDVIEKIEEHCFIDYGK